MDGRRWCYLEISQLGKLFATAFQSAGKGLDLLVDNLVSPDIASLGEPLPAGFARVRSFARVASFMGLPSVNDTRK